MGLKSESLRYLANGWSVIRLLHKTKDSPAGAWAKYYSEHPTVEEVKTWPEGANVAIVTGGISGIAVIDFDPRHGADPEAFLQRHPTGRVVDTGGGGVHAFYRIPEGMEIRCRVGLRPGIDVRGEGGYVVAPPSVHPNGKPYVWRSEGEMALFPSELLESVNLRHANPPGWVEKTFGGIVEGGRDNACAQLAGFLYAKGISRSVAVPILQGWNLQNNPPLPAEDIEITVDSVYKRAIRMEQRQTTATALKAPSSTGFELLKFSDYMALHATGAVEWIVRDWLPSKTIAFVISPPGTYKTWTILDLCVSVAGGTPFLGKFPIEETGPVMLIQQEDFNGQTVERLSVISHSRYNIHAKGGDKDNFEVGTPPDLPIWHHTQRRLRFDDKLAMKDFSDAIEKHRPKLVVLDPLYSATSTDDFMSKAAEDMFLFKDLRDRYGTSFLVCHHTKKTGDDRARDRIWGSQFLNAFLETGWHFSQRSETSIGIRRHFKAAAEPKDIVLAFDINTDESEYRYRVQVLDPDEVKTDAKAALAEAGREGADRPPDYVLQKNEIFQFLIQHPNEFFSAPELIEKMNMGRSTIFKKLKPLLLSYIVTKTEDGTYGIVNPGNI